MKTITGTLFRCYKHDHYVPPPLQNASASNRSRAFLLDSILFFFPNGNAAHWDGLSDWVGVPGIGANIFPAAAVVEFKFCIALIAALSSSPAPAPASTLAATPTPAAAPFPNHRLAKCRLSLLVLVLSRCCSWCSCCCIWWCWSRGLVWVGIAALVGTSTHSRKTIFKLERFCTSPTRRVRRRQPLSR